MNDNLRTVIIGNGFDLDLGWPTSYKNFMDWMNSTKSDLIPQFVQSLLQKQRTQNWIDLEMEFRYALVNTIENTCQFSSWDINQSWVHIIERFANYITNKFGQDGECFAQMKTLSCAAEFYRRLNENDHVYTFNYTYPYVHINKQPHVTHVHGKFKYINHDYMEMIWGIDNQLYDELKYDEHLKVLFKEYNDLRKDCDIVTSLSRSREVIFWGHSLGLTDSDYYKHFFDDILSGKSQCEKIVFVTFDKESELGIGANMKQLGFELNALKAKRCYVQFVHTKNAINDGMVSEEYQEFISIL